MRSLRGWARVEFWAELPENDGDADDAFDAICDEITTRLNEREISYVARESFSIADADTLPDDD